jgi:hypothetical protein
MTAVSLCVCMHRFVTLMYFSCICVIYKCLSWDSNQQRDLGKPDQRNGQAKLSMGSC